LLHSLRLFTTPPTRRLYSITTYTVAAAPSPLCPCLIPYHTYLWLHLVLHVHFTCPAFFRRTFVLWRQFRLLVWFAVLLFYLTVTLALPGCSPSLYPTPSRHIGRSLLPTYLTCYFLVLPTKGVHYCTHYRCCPSSFPSCISHAFPPPHLHTTVRCACLPALPTLHCLDLTHHLQCLKLYVHSLPSTLFVLVTLCIYILHVGLPFAIWITAAATTTHTPYTAPFAALYGLYLRLFYSPLRSSLRLPFARCVGLVTRVYRLLRLLTTSCATLAGLVRLRTTALLVVTHRCDPTLFALPFSRFVATLPPFCLCLQVGSRTRRCLPHALIHTCRTFRTRAAFTYPRAPHLLAFRTHSTNTTVGSPFLDRCGAQRPTHYRCVTLQLHLHRCHTTSFHTLPLPLPLPFPRHSRPHCSTLEPSSLHSGAFHTLPLNPCHVSAYSCVTIRWEEPPLLPIYQALACHTTHLTFLPPSLHCPLPTHLPHTCLHPHPMGLYILGATHSLFTLGLDLWFITFTATFIARYPPPTPTEGKRWRLVLH